MGLCALQHFYSVLCLSFISKEKVFNYLSCFSTVTLVCWCGFNGEEIRLQSRSSCPKPSKHSGFFPCMLVVHLLCMFARQWCVYSLRELSNLVWQVAGGASCDARHAKYRGCHSRVQRMIVSQRSRFDSLLSISICGLNKETLSEGMVNT
jgi:hypothetical protein